MKKLKKLLAILAVLSIGTTSFPVSASEFDSPETEILAQDGEETPTSGTWSDNLTWNFNTETGTLTISGTGNMQNWSLFRSTPWSDVKEEIHTLIIENGVTNIGSGIFSNYPNLTSVSIPNSVTTIGNFAFRSCPNLTSVSISEGVTTIGDWAFDTCPNLTDITIPESVTNIGAYAFSDCTGLTSVVIPESVTEINSRAFGSCEKLESITIKNSDCEILSNAIFNGEDENGEYYHGIIYGYVNSTAQSYAEQYGYTFEALDSGSEPAPIEPPPTEPAPSTVFTDGNNNWCFANSSRNFGETRYISIDYLAKLLQGLSRTECIKVLSILSGEFKGSCYGMACTSILSCYDILKPSDYQENANSLHDIDAPPSKEVQSLINYYFALQSTDKVHQLTAQALCYQTEEEKIQQLLQQLEDDSPVLLTFFLGENAGGHAVVAYGVERGNFSVDSKSYDTKILIYDNNFVDFNDNACMYINTSENSWTIPYYSTANTADGGTIGLTTDNLQIINYHGYLDGSDIDMPQEYIPILSSEVISSDFSLRRITLNEDSWSINSTADDEIKQFSSFTSGDAPADMKFAVKDNTKGCMMQIKQPEKINMSMCYENDFIQTNFEHADEVVFDPSGYVSVSGETSAYTLDLTSNDGYAPTDWYEMNASGTASEVTFYKTSDGYIMKADNLENVSLSAKSDNFSPSLTFSTEYSEVFIYETDENTIGVAVDTDENGSYETILTGSGSSVAVTMGDLNADDKTNAEDSAMILTEAANIGIGQATFTEEQTKMADVNQDGSVNAVDAAVVLTYAAENGAGVTSLSFSEWLEQ